MGEILINKMASQFNLLGYRESTIDVGITVGVYLDSDIPIEINTRALGNSNKNVELDVVYSGYKSINVELIPALHSNIPVEIEVNPHNKMSVYYELTQPPISTHTGFPVEDSFVAQKNPYMVMNYGSNNSMMIGHDQKGENISFVKFNTSVISNDVLVKSAKFRLYYSQLNGSIFELYRVIDKWKENSITYANMPTDLRLITNQSINNTVDRYIEFDVTDIVSSFIKGVPNEGFALKSLDGTSILRTREYNQPPELIVEYFSPNTLNVGNSRKQVEISVRQKDNSIVPVDLTVKTDFGFSYLPVTIFAKHPNDVFNSDIPIEIDAVAAPITSMDKDVPVEITVIRELTSFIPVEIEVPIYDGNSDIPTEIIVRKSDNSVVNIDIEVPLYNEQSNVNVELTVQRRDDSSIPIDIEVPQYTGESNLIVEIQIGNYHDSIVNVEIEVPSYNSSSSITVEIGVGNTSFSMKTVTIEVPSYNSSSSITVEIGVGNTSFSMKTVTIEVPSYQGESNIPIELGVIARESSCIPVEIEVQYKDRESNISVDIAVWDNGESVIPVEISVTRESINVGITVPYYDNSNVSVELLPRVQFVNDLPVEITIKRSSRYAYAFII